MPVQKVTKYVPYRWHHVWHSVGKTWVEKELAEIKAKKHINTCIIIITHHHYAYFMQFDWLEKTFYTSINSISNNLGAIFLPPAPNMYNNVDKNMI